MHLAASGGLVAVLKLLAAKGAPVAVKSGQAGTPLHWACGEGRATSVRALIELGAPLDETNAQVGQDPLPLPWAHQLPQ